MRTHNHPMTPQCTSVLWQSSTVSTLVIFTGVESAPNSGHVDDGSHVRRRMGLVLAQAFPQCVSQWQPLRYQWLGLQSAVGQHGDHHRKFVAIGTRSDESLLVSHQRIQIKLEWARENAYHANLSTGA